MTYPYKEIKDTKNNFMIKECFKDKTKVILGFLLLISVSLLVLVTVKLYQLKSEKEMPNVEFTDSSGIYNKIYHSCDDIEDIRNMNKSLYDSIKSFKDEIGFLLYFKFSKEYSTGQVETGKNDSLATTFVYTNNPNDTLQYNLKVNAREEPVWYSLDITLNNAFTIINREFEDANHITIESENGGDIKDVTVFNRKDKRKGVFDRFAIGPSIGVGYDPIRQQLAPTIGVSITFDLKR